MQNNQDESSFPLWMTLSPPPASKAITSSHSCRCYEITTPPFQKYPESYQAAIDFDDYPYSQMRLFFMLFGFRLYIQKNKAKSNPKISRHYWRATQKIGNVWHHVHICPGNPFHLPEGLFQTARYKIAHYLLENNIWVPDLNKNQQPNQEDVHGEIEFILVKQIDRMADISTTTSDKEPIPIQRLKPIFPFPVCPSFPSLFCCD